MYRLKSSTGYADCNAWLVQFLRLARVSVEAGAVPEGLAYPLLPVMSDNSIDVSKTVLNDVLKVSQSSAI